ncbi:MAG: hypothetical protein Q4E36_02645 [Bacillota bacterium]|nr:hypothetical protein [Bacillota bacterium]
MKKLLKILLVLVLIGGLYVANGLFGNPLSKQFAKFAINKYIEVSYPARDFEKGEIFYNFKTASYTMDIQDRTSQDTSFEIGADSFGQIKYDTYSDILFNTWLRFSDALRIYGRDLAQENSKAYEISLSIDDSKGMEVLSLDQEVDLENFPFQVSALAQGFADQADFSKAMEILRDLDRLMGQTSLDIRDYSIILIPESDRADQGQAQSWTKALSIYNIPVASLRSASIEDLEELYKIQSQPIEDKDY